ncbi:MAG TPA: hypothetical protein DCX07_05700 [Phycisphaerales bacterium]|nr:hypothetical protein [Phycisphaerales bacterium]
MLALWFATPLLLIGLLAAGIPPLLHLLSRVRAQEVYFPTLRFLQRSMEKTARRRRIQHWLLLVFRSSLLALLAVSVAEPISQATGGWLAGRNYAAVVVLDNSLSMGARDGAQSRFARAQAQAIELLSGDDRPSLAAVLPTNAAGDDALTARLEALRKTVSETTLSNARAPVAQKLARAMDLLAGETSLSKKAIYLFSDLQQVSFEELASLKSLAAHKDIHLLVVNCASQLPGKPDNVAISDVEIGGRPVVHERLTFTVTLVNSSPVDRTVSVAMRVEGQPVALPVKTTLRAAGLEGDSRTVRFFHTFGKSGPVACEVFLDVTDDLPADNVRRFALDVGGRVGAVIVRGPRDPAEAPGLDSAAALLLAADPFGRADRPWPVQPRVVPVEELSAETLAGADIAFFTDVPSLTDAQAKLVRDFVRTAGGTAAFFLGPAVQAENYNARLGEILPAELDAPVGEVGVDLPAVALDWVDAQHPYFEGLYANPRDYLTSVTQRYFRLKVGVPPQVLMRLAGGAPLLVSRDAGRGRCLLCVTTASPRWTSLPASPVFLPMVVRMCLLARSGEGGGGNFLAGSQVTLRPRGLALPPDGAPPAALRIVREGDEASSGYDVKFSPAGEAVFDRADRLGVYRWQATGADGKSVEGCFAVNPPGTETRLTALPPAALRQMLARDGLDRVYVGDDLSGATAAASADAQGRNWWDYLLAAVLVVLVVEAVVANRVRRRDEDAVPAYLNPKIAA